jgi:hypothetical protein
MNVAVNPDAPVRARADGGTLVRVEESLEGLLSRLFRTPFQKGLDAGIQKSLSELGMAAEGAGPT